MRLLRTNLMKGGFISSKAHLVGRITSVATTSSLRRRESSAGPREIDMGIKLSNNSVININKVSVIPQR